MNFVWILVTLITDWNTVFYRKAIIYRKRVDDELQSRRLRQSFTNDTTSLFSGNQYNSSSPSKKGGGSQMYNPDVDIKAQTDTKAMIREQKEQINRQAVEIEENEKERSGSFGAYKNYQRMLQNVTESDSPDPHNRGSTAFLNDFTMLESIRMTSVGHPQ